MKLNFIPIIFCTLLVLGCASTDNRRIFSEAQTGKAQQSVTATVLSAKPILIQKDTSGLGATAGALAGGGIAGESTGNVAIIIAGIIWGAVVGEAIEGAANIVDGTEYVIQADTGTIFTVAQINKGYEALNVGQSVILVYGSPTKLLPDPRQK